MSDLTIERPENGYAVWKNRDGDIVCDWNDDANINFPEDLTSHRDIGDLVSVVYKKGFSDGNMQLKQQLEWAVNVIKLGVHIQDADEADIVMEYCQKFLAKYREEK